MLVLSRKAGESVLIGENITVKVVECRGNRVRLAFDAPKDVEILRAEIAEWRDQWFDCPAECEAELEPAFA